MSALLELSWQKDRQWFAFAGDRFEHLGETGTTVAHDLCHLAIAANGNLEWKPAGEDASIRRAEFNAVYLEWIYHGVYERLSLGRPLRQDLLGRALGHARDFVERYYSPFPTTFAVARAEFHKKLEPELAARFFPAYVNTLLMDQSARRAPYPTAFLRFKEDARFPWADKGAEELLEALERARKRWA